MKVKSKLLHVFLVLTLVMSCLAIVPVAVDASEIEGTVTTEKGIKYVPYDMSEYWATTKQTAPEMTDYVFGGWYTKSGDKFTAIKEARVTVDENTGKANMSGTYAKFVKAEVLSVKSQVDVDTETNGLQRTQSASIRLISGLDSTDYQKVGFKVLLANKKPVYKDNDDVKKEPLETTRIYTGLKKSASDSNIVEPSALFGEQAEFLSVWRLDNIVKANDSKIINVTPYWITMDGTKVEGLPKYVHVEDSYMGYISVPINLRTAQQVAAGKMTLTYPTGLELVEEKVEFDGVFPAIEMEFKDNGNGRIDLVGNAKDVDVEVDANGIYANLRFRVGTSGYQGVENGDFLAFTISNEYFIDWDEKDVPINVWDIKY